MVVVYEDKVEEEKLHGATLKVLLSPRNGSRLFDLCITTLDIGSQSEPHSHTAMQEAFYVLEGRGIFFCGEQKIDVRPGTVIHVPNKTEHYALNNGEKPLKLIAVRAPPKDNLPEL